MLSILLPWKLRFIGRRPEYEEVREYILSRMPHGGVAAEIGVDQGTFSKRIIEIARPQRLYLIDPWLSDARGAAEVRYQSTKQLLADELADGIAVLTRETSASAVTKFTDSSLDWIYIDGDHRYEAVKHDLESYFPKIKPGGFIICDDYHYAGHWDDGVTRAVDEFMQRRLVKKIFQRRSQFVMRKPRTLFQSKIDINRS